MRNEGLGENKFFKEALHRFTFDVACGGAIRHLYDLGFKPKDIAARLDFPVSISQVEGEIDRYIKEKEEKAKGNDYEYVRVTDEYGHSSFLKRKK